MPLMALAFILLSGDEEIIKTLTPTLSKMTGKLLYFGTEPGKAAAMKLAGNAFLVCLTAGLKDTLTLSKSLRVSVEDLLTLFNSWNPGTLSASPYTTHDRRRSFPTFMGTEYGPQRHPVVY